MKIFKDLLISIRLKEELMRLYMKNILKSIYSIIKWILLMGLLISF